MHLSLSTASVLLLATRAFAQVRVADIKEDDFVGHNDTIVPQRYIIEVAAHESISQVQSRIKSNGGKILKTFDSALFKGLSVESEKDNVDSLQRGKGVVDAWAMTSITLAPIKPQQIFEDDLAAKNWSVHRYTGVEKAHEAGHFGKGAVVAVIDSGVQYTHEALGGCFGEGCKVAGGYDLVGDGYWPAEGEKVPDDDPMDYYGHGTHVVGILAGKSDHFVGVAPEATILMYKVTTEYGSSDEDTLIQAFLMAYEDGADIITASIGGVNGWSTNAWAVIASRLVDNGVVVTIAAGNEGIAGPFFGSNGSLGPHVIAVGSTDAGEIPADPFEMTFSLDGADNTSTYAYLPAEEPMTVKGLPITPMVLHAPDNENACQPFTFKGRAPDLSKSIPLIRTGGCYNWEKQNNLRDLGAEYILFYNPDGPFNRVSSYVSTPLVNIIEAAAGEAIISTVKAGGKVTVDFSKQGDYKLGVYNSVGGLPSPFTSWGGTFDGNVKPDIAAPGGNIYSTFPYDTYAVFDGTSMATPYIAGVAALWVGKFGGRKQHGPEWARQLSNRIVSSGAAVRWHTETTEDQNPIDNGLWAPVHQVGAGQVDAWKVLDYTTSLEFDNMALNDTHTFSRYHKVQIRNNGKETVTYKFALQPAAALNIKSVWREGYLTDLQEPLDPYTFAPEVSFPTGTFKVAPGQVKTAQFNFEPPKGLDEGKLPIYSGKVLIRSSIGEELSVPYQGLGFNSKEKMRRNMFSRPPEHLGGAGRDDIKYYHSYNFNVTRYVQSYPMVYTELQWGCKELRWDIFEANWPEHRWSYPPVEGENGYIGSVTYWRGSGSAWAFDGYGDRDDVIAFPVRDLPRYAFQYNNRGAYWWMGRLADGSLIQPGNYTMRFAALIPYGNPKNSDNWHIWDTPQIEIRELEI